MSDTFKNINDYALQEHAEAFKALLNVFAEFGLRFFLIGAQARDVHFMQKEFKPNRGTRDIDFAVMVESIDQYNDLCKGLLSNGFEETKDSYRLKWTATDTVIDLLPYGGIQNGDYVSLDGGKVELSVLGFQEIEDELEDYVIEEIDSVSIPVPPLHGIFLLKLLSWHDKKPGREKDLQDIDQILRKYWEFVEDEAYEKHQDLFDDEFEMEMAAARILGRNLRVTLSKSKFLKEKVLNIFQEQSEALDDGGSMIHKLAGYSDQPVSYLKKKLEEILKGIND